MGALVLIQVFLSSLYSAPPPAPSVEFRIILSIVDTDVLSTIWIEFGIRFYKAMNPGQIRFNDWCGIFWDGRFKTVKSADTSSTTS